MRISLTSAETLENKKLMLYGFSIILRMSWKSAFLLTYRFIACSKKYDVAK